MTDEEIATELTAKMLEVISADGDPANLYFAAWRAAHGMDGDCSMPYNIVEQAVNLLVAQHQDLADEDLTDLAYAHNLIQVDAVLVVNVGGKQFFMSAEYDMINHKDVLVTQEIDPPIDFSIKEEHA
jgi:hypothetical protein